MRLAEIEFDRRFTLISGPNASGKTSLLEAIYVLGRGRSFRTRRLERLIRHGADRFVVFGEVDDAVFAGDVGGGDDGELVPGDGRVEVDGENTAPGDGAADGGSEPHAGEGDVVDVLGLAEDFGRAFFA